MTAAGPIKIADAGERTTAFRRARVNTVFVRIMRWLLPALAVCFLGSYLLFMQHTFKIETKLANGKLTTGIVSAGLDNLSMTDPSYEGYNKKDGSHYRVSAKKAITDLSRDKPIELIEIEGAFQQRNGNRTVVKAASGVFDQKKGQMQLDGGIDIAAPDGLRVRLNRATIDTNDASIVSEQPVLVEMPAGSVRGNTMRLDQKQRKVEFGDGVAAVLRPAKTPTRAATVAAAPAQSASARSPLTFGGSSGAPVNVTSNKLAIVEKERTAEFSGGVRADQDGRVLRAPILVVAFDGAPMLGRAQQSEERGSAAASMASQARLRQIVAKNGVELSDGDNRLTAQTAIFDAETRKAELIGGVRVIAPENRTISADRATINSATNEVVMLGDVVARQAESILRGRRLVYEPGIGRLQLTSPGRLGAASSDIFVRFTMPSRGKRAPARPAGRGPGSMAFSTNPDAPIEISAKTLDVQDLKTVARFEGGVRARQGDLVLSTPVLTAHYVGTIGLLGDRSKRPAAAQRRMELRFIRAIKPVKVTSGDEMEASGETAEFDMAADTVTIEGNVVLRQGRQKLYGDRLLIDLKTGLSRLQKAPGNIAPKPFAFGAQPVIRAETSRRDCGGRMCAVFFPDDARKRQEQRKAPSPAAQPRSKLGSGWSTTVN